MGIESSAIATAIQAVRALVTVYDGYEKGRFMKSDEAVRSEIQRRCEMLIRHGEKLEQDAHRRGHRNSRMACAQAIETLQAFKREAQFSTTANHVSKHKGIGKLKSASVRKLVTMTVQASNRLLMQHAKPIKWPVKSPASMKLKGWRTSLSGNKRSTGLETISLNATCSLTD